MNTTVNDLLNAILNDKPTEVKAAFDSAIQDKIADITSDMKQDQAANMFEPAVETTDAEPSDDADFDETLFDDFTDEELEAINNMSDEEWDALLDDIESEEPDTTEDDNG